MDERLSLSNLVSKQEARNLKLEYRASIYEPPCLPAGRDTSFDNVKRQFQLNDTGLVTLTIRLFRQLVCAAS